MFLLHCKITYCNLIHCDSMKDKLELQVYRLVVVLTNPPICPRDIVKHTYSTKWGWSWLVSWDRIKPYLIPTLCTYTGLRHLSRLWIVLARRRNRCHWHWDCSWAYLSPLWSTLANSSLQSRSPIPGPRMMRVAALQTASLWGTGYDRTPCPSLPLWRFILRWHKSAPVVTNLVRNTSPSNN